jgi:ribosomal protein S18 acetylase RimI-like enzyme
MEIRNAKDKDFVDCVNIVRKAWPEFKERESIYHLFCKHFSDTSFIAEENGITSGFLLGFLSQTYASQAYIHLVAVDPRYQRRGFAKRLYKQFLNTAMTKGRSQVKLIVNPDNLASLEFHRRLGFRVHNEESTIDLCGIISSRDYNGPGNHMVVFEKDLRSKELRDEESF